MAATTPLLDAAIIGGGPAGLSVATGLARQLHTAVLFDSGVYRNRFTKHMHNVAGWDHIDPANFRAAARSDILRRYKTIEFQELQVDMVKKTDTGTFEVVDATGKAWRAKKLVLASGVEDIFPDIDGYADCWARGIFHCLFCHGYEERGVPSAGVLAIEATANLQLSTHLARMAGQLAEKVTIYTNGNMELTKELSQKTLGSRVQVDSRRIQRLEKGPSGSDVIMHLEGPSEIRTEGFIAHAPRTKINGPFAAQLQLETLPTGEVKTNPPFFETSTSGVFAAGDIATPLKAVTQALAMGTFVAGGLSAQVLAEGCE